MMPIIEDLPVQCQGVVKRFGRNVALHPTDMRIASGIHAFVGQNGAGKSTLLGLIAGRLAPSGGTVRIFGKAVRPGDPRASRAAGVAAIYQELTVIPVLSAMENVFLGQLPGRVGVVARHRMRRRFVTLCERLGVRIDADAQARNLTLAERQVLEIMRAVESNANVILFDEPTASLAPAEREALFRLMRELRAESRTLIFVSHRLEEVLELADEISVFRNGRLAASRQASDWTKSELVAAMVGVRLGDVHRRRAGRCGSRLLLQATGVSVSGAISDLSLSVREGEIVGVGGLAGSGRSTLLRALAGLERTATGTLRLGGEVRPWPATSRTARGYGIALVPEERKRTGLVLGMSTEENIVIADWSSCARHGWLSNRRKRDQAIAASEPLCLDRRKLGDPVGRLSGGNQQKVLLARWRHARPAILLVDEPTRGIDIGAKSEVLDALRAFANDGTGVVIVSSEFEEMVSVCDRVVVVAAGRQVRELHADMGEVSVPAILNAAFEHGGTHVQD